MRRIGGGSMLHIRAPCHLAHGLRRSSDSRFPVRCPACGGHGTWHPGRQPSSARRAARGCRRRRSPVAPEAFEFLHLLRIGRTAGATGNRRDARALRRVRDADGLPGDLAGRNCEGCGSPALDPCDETARPCTRPARGFLLTEPEARERVAPPGSKRSNASGSTGGASQSTRCALCTRRGGLQRPRANTVAPRAAEDDRDGETEREESRAASPRSRSTTTSSGHGVHAGRPARKSHPFDAADLVACDHVTWPATRSRSTR